MHVQASAPWASNSAILVPPVSLIPFKFLNTIQLGVVKASRLLGAFNVPLISTFGDWLLWQGPVNETGPTKNVPSGIYKVEFPG